VYWANRPAAAETSDNSFAESLTPTQTVVQTSQTILITPPLRGLALGAVSNGASSTRFRPGRGGLTGRAFLTTNPPPEIPFDVTASPECQHLAETPPTTKNYVVSPDGGLADVLVWLKPNPSREIVDPVRETIELTFTNCGLQPRMVAALPWHTFVARNNDSIRHVLHIRLRDELAPMTEIELHPGQTLSERFGVLLGAKGKLFLSLRCGLHPWEQAYASLVTSPFFAVTDANGRFAINDVPAGNYKVEAFHRHATGTNAIVGSIRIDSGRARNWDVGFLPRLVAPQEWLSAQAPKSE
jgi:hypothetical protein